MGLGRMWLLGVPLMVRCMARRAHEMNVQIPLDAAEGVLIPLLGLDLKVEGAGGGGSSGEVDTGDLLEAQVYRRLVHVNETSLQRIQQT